MLLFNLHSRNLKILMYSVDSSNCLKFVYRFYKGDRRITASNSVMKLLFISVKGIRNQEVSTC